MKPSFYLLLITILLSSCISREKLNYFQDAGVADTVTKELRQVQEQKIAQIRIRPYDILDVRVKSPDDQTNQLFSPGGSGGGGGGNAGLRGEPYRVGYSVDKDGTVELPLIGEVNVLNLTLKEARNVIKEKLSEFVREPYVQLKFLNYKIFVLGEVRNPGMITINNEQATVMEAISQAGGMKLFGRRENVRVFRGSADNPIVHELDLTKVSSMNSPGYFCQPYDIIYVEPLRRKTILSNVTTINAIVGILNTTLSFLFLFLTTN